jgi:Ser/Thr protein kinase RdoA (MazF antagonist)
MTALNDFLESLSAERVQELYSRVAYFAMGEYPLENCTINFIQHNSGITYRVEIVDSNSHFLLKIHEPVGTGSKISYEQLLAQMMWLENLSHVSAFAVQTPIQNKQGEWVTRIQVPEVDDTLLCTVQKWVEGKHTEDDLTLQQVEAVGKMIAQLHNVSSQFDMSTKNELKREDVTDLWAEIRQLQSMIDVDVLSKAQFAALESARRKIEQILDLLGDGADVYGPIHGDLHQENLLFADGAVCPIDFDGLRNSYYLLDLGISLYHILYQGAEFCRTLVGGYSSVRELSAGERSYLDAFVTWSAIDNLAFQCTIPQQVKSKFFIRNIHQLTDEFCLKVIANEPFVLI